MPAPKPCPTRRSRHGCGRCSWGYLPSPYGTYHDGGPTSPRGPDPRQGVFRRARAQLERLPGKGRPDVPGAARSGRRRGHAQRGGGGRRRPHPGVDLVLRSGVGSLSLDVAPDRRGTGRMTVVAEHYAVRVMVTDVWHQAFLPVEPTTTVAQLTKEALATPLRRRVPPHAYSLH